MKPMLDDLELPQVQEITTLDRRVLPDLKPPGMAGSTSQNLGRRPTDIVVRGVATGPTSTAFMAKLDAKFRAAKPVPFASDIVADAKIDRVLINNVHFVELAGKPARFAYAVTLREFIVPVAPIDTSGIDLGILGDALGLAKNLVAGLGAGAAFASALARFVPTFAALLARAQSAAKN